MIRYLGYPCINMTLSDVKKKEDRIFTSRTTRLKFANIDKCDTLAELNVIDLSKIIDWNIQNDIKFFRISSQVFPFMDHPEVGYSLEDLPSSNRIISILREIGIKCKENKIKLEVHPGPYNCLASDNQKTVDKTIVCLEMHNLLLDLLQYDNRAKINIHVGRSLGDKDEIADKFSSGFERLSDGCKSRLTVENDDKQNGWTTQQLVDKIYGRISTPITFDYHHHSLLNANDTPDAAAALAFTTWDCTPTIHYSERSTVKKKPQAHDDWITKLPQLDVDRNFDVMIEAKQKERALLQLLTKEAICK
jgi:UV DNA damage endonuclease